MGDSYGVQLTHPFVDSSVLTALSKQGGFAGMGNRTAIMQTLFGDVLPSSIVSRVSKGSFTDPLWTQDAVDFARGWDGRGVPIPLVDPESLQMHWRGEERNILSTTLLQSAWLSR